MPKARLSPFAPLHEPHPIMEVGEGVLDAATGGITGFGRASGGVGNIGTIRAAQMEWQNAVNRWGMEDPRTKALEERFHSLQQGSQRTQPAH